MSNQATYEHNENLRLAGVRIQNILSGFLFNSAILGGLARDTYYGVKAKDVDVCVYGFHPNDGAEELLFDKLLDALIAAFPSTVLNWGGSTPSESVHQVVNVITIPELNVDIIFYEDCVPAEQASNPMYARFNIGRRVTSRYDIARQFDCNLNQFAFNKEGDAVFIGVPAQHPDNGLVMLREVSEERTSKMARKYADAHNLNLEEVYNSLSK